MKSSVKWIVLMTIIFSAIPIGIIVYQSNRENTLLEKEGVVCWAKVTGSHSEKKYTGRRGSSQTSTKHYFNISFQAENKPFEGSVEKLSELDNLRFGDSIKIIYAVSDPSVLRVFKNENGKISWKRGPNRRTKFFGSSGE